MGVDLKRLSAAELLLLHGDVAEELRERVSHAAQLVVVGEQDLDIEVVEYLSRIPGRYMLPISYERVGAGNSPSMQGGG